MFVLLYHNWKHIVNNFNYNKAVPRAYTSVKRGIRLLRTPSSEPIPFLTTCTPKMRNKMHMVGGSPEGHMQQVVSENYIFNKASVSRIQKALDRFWIEPLTLTAQKICQKIWHNLFCTAIDLPQTPPLSSDGSTRKNHRQQRPWLMIHHISNLTRSLRT